MLLELNRRREGRQTSIKGFRRYEGLEAISKFGLQLRHLLLFCDFVTIAGRARREHVAVCACYRIS